MSRALRRKARRYFRDLWIKRLTNGIEIAHVPRGRVPFPFRAANHRPRRLDAGTREAPLRRRVEIGYDRGPINEAQMLQGARARGFRHATLASMSCEGDCATSPRGVLRSAPTERRQSFAEGESLARSFRRNGTPVRFHGFKKNSKFSTLASEWQGTSKSYG